MPGVLLHPLPLLRGWPRHVRSAVVQVISLAGASLAATRGWASDSMNTSLRQRAEVDRLQQEIRLLREVRRCLWLLVVCDMETFTILSKLPVDS